MLGGADQSPVYEERYTDYVEVAADKNEVIHWLFFTYHIPDSVIGGEKPGLWTYIFGLDGGSSRSSSNLHMVAIVVVFVVLLLWYRGKHKSHLGRVKKEDSRRGLFV